MLAFGLTGGIGAGKSAVERLLTERGAIVIDADQVAREVVVPGAPAFGQLVERFGPGIVTAGGTLDRPALAAIAFADPVALADLNAITHPPIAAAISERMRALAGTDSVVVVSVPLLAAAHRARYDLDAVVVVDCPVEVALQRLVASRGMDERDARARMAAQPSREERLALADYVVDNSGSYGQLVERVDGLWRWIQGRRPARAAP